MKTELTIISDDLNHGIIDEKQARALLLGLLGVVGRSEQLADYLQNVIGKKYGIYFEQQDIDGLIEIG